MNAITTDTLKQLRDKFPESHISWRVGRMNQDRTVGQALPYIDNRLVQNRLDDVLGPQNWTNRFIEVISNNRLMAVRCIIGVNVGGTWVEKEDAAQLDDVGNGNREIAVKGVYSDAMKRAAVQWGIGRYLYDYAAPYVELDNGRLVEAPKLPPELLPAEEAAVRAEELKNAPAPVAKPAPVKAEVKPEVKPEVKQEPKVEQKAEPKEQPVKAEQPQEHAPADKPVSKAASVLQPETQEAPEQRVAATQEVREQVQEKPAAQPARVADEAGSDERPANLTDEQNALVDDLLTKIEKLPPKMIRAYIAGPKGQEKLNKEARDFLLARVARKEAALEAS